MSFATRLVLGTVLILVLTVGILFWVAERTRMSTVPSTSRIAKLTGYAPLARSP